MPIFSTLYGTNGADTFSGGVGSDLIYGYPQGGTPGADTGNDSLSGGDSNDTIFGGGGDDTLSGDAGDDSLYGDDGNDVLSGGTGGDVLDGGAGVGDTASYASSAAGVTIDLGAGTASGGDAAGDVLFGIENLLGSAQADSLTGDANDNTIEGGAGGDTLVGAGGIDTLSYAGSALGVAVDLGAGTGTAGDAAGDVVSGFENILGSALGDQLTGDGLANTLDGGAGADSLYGGGGDDVFFVDVSSDKVIEALGGGSDTVFASVTFQLGAEVETLVLTGTGDTNGTGNASANIIFGNTGTNRLDGKVGADTLYGGVGNDVLFDRDGGDTLDGGAGNDSYVAFAAGTTVVETLDAGSGGGIDILRSYVTATLSANVENLALLGSGATNGTGNELANFMTGNNAVNTLTGLAGQDRLVGNAGDDLLDGGTENDLLYGGAGSDTLLGGDGADRLDGGVAGDKLTGGAGADQFLFLDAFFFDQVTDFQDGLDKLNLSDLREENGGAKLTFDQLLVTQAGAATRIQLDLDRNGVVDSIDLDGDGIADSVRIDLLNTSKALIGASDFIF